MADSPKLENVRAALRSERGKTALAEKVGCSENNLHKIASGYIRHPSSEVVDALCRELKLDMVTGLPLPAAPKATYKLVLRKGKSRPSSGKTASPDAHAPVFTEKTAHSCDLPSEMEVSEEEMRIFESARKGPKDFVGLKIRMVAMGVSEVVAETIFHLLDGRYARAVELLGRVLAQSDKKRR